MKKINKFILSLTILPIVPTSIIPLVSCNKKGLPEGAVTDAEWRKAFAKLIDFGTSKPTFKTTGWDDHMRIKDANGNVTLNLVDIVVNKNLISCKNKAKQTNNEWYDCFDTNIDYISHEGDIKIIDLNDSIIPKFFYQFCGWLLNSKKIQTFDEFAQQYVWKGEIPALKWKNIDIAIAFNSDKNISMIHAALDETNEQGQTESYDVELHLKYEETEIKLPEEFETRISSHTYVIDGSSPCEIDMTSAGTETEGYIFNISNCPMGTKSICVYDGSELVDVFESDKTSENAPIIYLNDALLDKEYYSISKGKITLNDAVKPTYKINLRFKPKTYTKVYTLKTEI